MDVAGNRAGKLNPWEGIREETMEGEVLTVRLEQQPEGAAPGALVFPAKFGDRTGEVEMHGEPPGGGRSGSHSAGKGAPLGPGRQVTDAGGIL